MAIWKKFSPPVTETLKLTTFLSQSQRRARFHFRAWWEKHKTFPPSTRIKGVRGGTCNKHVPLAAAVTTTIACNSKPELACFDNMAKVFRTCDACVAGAFFQHHCTNTTTTIRNFDSSVRAYRQSTWSWIYIVYSVSLWLSSSPRFVTTWRCNCLETARDWAPRCSGGGVMSWETCWADVPEMADSVEWEIERKSKEAKQKVSIIYCKVLKVIK